MVDTRKITRKVNVRGLDVVVKPYYEMGTWSGYIASAYNTTQRFPIYLNREFLHFGPYGNDEERTSREIAEHFVTYYLPSTRIGD